MTGPKDRFEENLHEFSMILHLRDLKSYHNSHKDMINVICFFSFAKFCNFKLMFMRTTLMKLILSLVP